MHNLHAPYLFETPRGSVLRCACCGRLEVRFAEVFLRGSRSHFRKLQRAVEATCASHKHEIVAWTLTLTHRGTGQVVAQLPAEKALELDRLLGGAQTMLELNDRLQNWRTTGQGNASCNSARP